MKRLISPVWILLILLMLFLSACGGKSIDVSFSTANIQNARLAKDEDGDSVTTRFAQEDTIYTLARLKNAPDGTTVRVLYTAVNVEGESPNTKIEETELTTGSAALIFTLSPTGSWPNGDYKVDLYLNDELDQTLTYTVVGPATAAADEPTKSATVEPVKGAIDERGDTARTTDKDGTEAVAADRQPAESSDVVADIVVNKGGAESVDLPAADHQPVEPSNATVVESSAEDTASSDAISTVEEARAAVIQIQAEGTFVEPEGIDYNMAGRGSGFIIHESGLAVTNNHVVTGAALVKVWLDGENRSRNARVVASSECSDLAVIDIEGDGFPHLEWLTGETRVGNEVYVAGFPLGDPEYTLTRGIVSKENADGESDWASIDHVLEYDARAVGGNSGGPVINSDARVVAVHYARSRQATGQAFGISSDIARRVVEELIEGRDVDSIGINGRAFINDDSSIFGIWVSSVKSGSPADRAGIRAGDLLRQLEGLVLATDGSMAYYCDILRSRAPEDVMSFSLWRMNTGEVLDGQINGREAKVVGMLGGDEAAGGTGASADAGSFMTITDDSGLLTVNVPVEWSQVDGSAWVNDAGETLGVSLVASPDIDKFFDTWSTPGIVFRASDGLDVDDKQLLDQFDFSNDCEYGGREAYEDQLYTGQYDMWVNCDGAGVTNVVLTALPADAAFVIFLGIQMASDTDVAVFEEILNSFVMQ